MHVCTCVLYGWYRYVVCMHVYGRVNVDSPLSVCTVVMERLKEVLEETETSILAFKDKQREV